MDINEHNINEDDFEVAGDNSEDVQLDTVNDLVLESDGEDNDEIFVTPAEVIQLLEEAWINEKFAPEILPHKSEVVECLLGQITVMEGNLEHLKSTDFRKSIYQIEIDRLRFLITSYLRTRLEKIETYVTHIIQQEELRNQQGEEPYLSNEEFKFAKDFSKNVEEYFVDLTKFYPGLPTEDWSNQLVKPNIHSFVFLKSKKEIEGVMIDDGSNTDNDLVDFSEDSQMIISYNSISDLLKKGDVNLI